MKRPSLKNLSLNRFDKSTIFFDSHDVSKADASSELNGTVDLEEDHRKLDDIVVAKIAETFREKLVCYNDNGNIDYLFNFSYLGIVSLWS